MSVIGDQPKRVMVDHCPRCGWHLAETWDDEAQECEVCEFSYLVPEWIAEEPDPEPERPQTLAGRVRRVLSP